MLLYTKNKYILKLLLNVVTAWIEALVLGNKFLYAHVKEVHHHWTQPRFDTFHQLLIIVEPILCKTCDSLSHLWSFCTEQCVKYVEIHMKALKLWSAIFHKFFGRHFEQDHSLQMADHFSFYHEHLFAHLWTFYTIVLHFLHSLHFGRKPQLAGLSHRKSLSRRQEQTIGDQLCNGLQGNESCDTTSHAWALPCSYNSCQKWTEVAFQITLVLNM
jgi:hypothetical protein